MRTNRITYGIGWALVMGMLSSSGVAGEAPSRRAQAERNFKTVEAQLDKGGDLFAIVNLEGAIENLAASIVGALASLPAGQSPEAATAAEYARRTHVFLQTNGFYTIQGLGFSTTPRDDQLHNIRMFLQRSDAAAMRPLWQALVGGKPATMHSLRFVDEDAVFVTAGSADAKALWGIIRGALNQIAPPDAAMQVEMGLSMASAQLQVSVEELIASLGSECVLALSLAQETRITVPMDDQTITLPAPSLLLATAVQNEAILSLLRRQAEQAGMALIEKTVAGTTNWSMALVDAFPMPMHLAAAQHGGFLLLTLSSDPAAIDRAITTFETGRSFATGAAFTQLFGKAPAELNGLDFMSARLMETVHDVSKQVQAQSGASPEELEATQSVINRLFGFDQRQEYASITVNQKTGVLCYGVSSEGGRELVASLAVAPVGIMAGIAIPAFAKARSQSRNNACINNLRIMDAAKEQAAMEHEWDAGYVIGTAAEDEASVLAYIRHATLPVCPQGGTYTLNPIGADPTCSIPGHSLNR